MRTIRQQCEVTGLPGLRIGFFASEYGFLILYEDFWDF